VVGCRGTHRRHGETGRFGRGTGQLTISNRVYNTADARRALQMWARPLQEALDEIYERPSASAQ